MPHLQLDQLYYLGGVLGYILAGVAVLSRWHSTRFLTPAQHAEFCARQRKELQEERERDATEMKHELGKVYDKLEGVRSEVVGQISGLTQALLGNKFKSE